jgi:nucleotide-binding universal stress UspA family protein
MKILIAIDSSAASQYVVSAAATRPWPSGTVFCVVSVVDLRQWEGMPVLIEEKKRQGQLLVKGAMEALAHSGHEVLSEVHLGFPKEAIPEYANQWGAGLVMVGSHGRSALTRFLLGSVAQAVLRTSPCSVEIVRPSPVPPSPSNSKILLATDGSECSAKAVSSVASRPWPANSQIRILSVIELPIIQTTPSPAYSEYPDTMFETEYKDAFTRAERAATEARMTLSAMDLNMCHAETTPEGGRDRDSGAPAVR